MKDSMLGEGLLKGLAETARNFFGSYVGKERLTTVQFPEERAPRIEAPKGELGFYLISDGSLNPYRYRVRPPSLINLTILEDLCVGQNVADVVVILGSIDIVLGEVDR